VRRVLATLLLAMVWLAASAAPASAHGIGVTTPTNYQTRVLSITPAVPGVTVSVIEIGKRLQIRNVSGTEITVVGYDGEPYLRIGPDGVLENRHSPTWWFNKTLKPTLAQPPAAVRAGADPAWHRVSTGRTARFHWHPAHWMGTSRPPIAARDPGHVHVIETWQLRMERGSERVVVRGDLRWLPYRSPWPEVLLAVILAAGVIVAGRTRQWRWVLVGGLAALIVVEAVHVAGIWTASYSGVMSRVGNNTYSLVGIVLGAWAIARLARSDDARDATPLAFVAGIVLVVAGGFTDLASLTRPVLPTRLPHELARALIAVVIGIGTGVVVTAGTHLSREQPPERSPEIDPAAAPDARRS
jgi:hypothetical protein